MQKPVGFTKFAALNATRHLTSSSAAPTNAVSIELLSSSGGQGTGSLGVAIPNSVLNLSTSGDNAYGILAQSIGGAGGGLAFAQNASLTNVQMATSEDAFGFGSTGGEVSISLEDGSSINTSGNGANAIVAQSIGGGGGIAGYATYNAGGTVFSMSTGSGFNYSDSPGDGGTVMLNIDAEIRTSGATADGILAQTLGSGGGLIATGTTILAGSVSTGSNWGGNIQLTQSGSDIVTGNNSAAVFAQGGQSGSSQPNVVAITAGGAIEGGSGAQGYGIWVDSGDQNLITVNNGGLVSSLSGKAINYTSEIFSGDDTAYFTTQVNNYGAVAGSVSLGTGGFLYNYGTYYINGTSLVLPDNVVNEAGGILGLSPSYQGGPTSLSQAISGSLPVLYQVDSGIFSIDTANSYTGGTTLAGGMVAIDNDAAFSTGKISVVNPTAGIQTSGDTAITLANPISLAQTLTLDTADAGSALTTTGTISGAGGLTTAGVGTVTLDGTDSYTGSTAVNGGTLIAGSASALPDTSVSVASGATLNLGGFATSFPTLTGAGDVTSSAGSPTLTIGDDDDFEFDGTIDSGIGALVITGNNGTDNTHGTVQPDDVTLMGANSYTGGTLLEDGPVGVTLGNDLALSTGTITANARDAYLYTTGDSPITLPNNIILVQPLNILVDTSNPDLTLSGNISGASDFYNWGTGTTILAGDNVYTGSTYLKAGTLQAGSDSGLDAASTFDLSSGATLDLNGYNSTIGALTGSGTVTNSGGDTAILNVGANGMSTEYAGLIEDDGPVGLNKIGAGVLVLDNANTYSGGTTITGGTLGIANANALGIGNVTNTGGILVAADGNRTIDVGGNYVQQPGGTLVLSINDLSSNFDRVIVNGDTQLGGRLLLDLSGLYAPGRGVTFAALQFNGGLSGEFWDISTGCPTLLASVDKSGLTLSQGAFASLAGANFTPNEKAVAKNIDLHDLDGVSQNFSNVVAQLNALSNNPAVVADDFSRFASDRFGEFVFSTTFNNASFLTQQFDSYAAGRRGADGFSGGSGGIDTSGLNMIDSRTTTGPAQVGFSPMSSSPAPVANDQAFVATAIPQSPGANAGAAQAISSPWHVYVAGNIILAQDAAYGPSIDVTTSVIQAGADYMLTPHILIGALFNYNHTSQTLDDLNSQAKLDDYAPGLYASYAERGWYGSMLASYGFNNMRETRHIAFDAEDDWVQATPSGNEQIISLDGGHDFQLRNWTFGPSAKLQYAHLAVNGFTESGGTALGLAVSQQNANSLRSLLGGHLTYALQVDGLALTTHLDLGWQHELLDDNIAVAAQFQSVATGSFAVVSPKEGRNAAQIGAGLNALLAHRTTMYINYGVITGESSYFGQSVQAGVNMAF